MAKEDESKIFAILAYVLSIIGFLIVLLAKKDDKFAMYHAKQSLVLFVASIIGWIVVAIVSAILVFIPVLGTILASLLSLALSIAVLYLWIVGIINAATMKQKPLPYIGGYAEKLKI